MNLSNIRNFSIIAHIDHGKSTLADRMLEVTGTIEARKMRDQVLDNMELERERGITIKMQPVRMIYNPNGTIDQANSGPGQKSNVKSQKLSNSEPFVLNLIDTPGHIDFSYEVSRALHAVEGSILLVDSTQGVQAQTLTTLSMARENGLTIIPVVSKIDSPLARPDDVALELAELLDVDPDTVIRVSGRTGEGVRELLDAVIERIPPPTPEDAPNGSMRALVFDFKYSEHRGVIVYVRMMAGSVARNTPLLFSASKESFICIETGIFKPAEMPTDSLSAGEIGYIVTGIKRPGIASVGDTITTAKNPLPALPGYMIPRPVVWASIYPESQDDFPELKLALGKLKLSDASFSFEEETSGALGRGFRCGFLGMLHLEIITERLRREFSLDLVVTMPSITYRVVYRASGKGGERREETIYSPHLFPDDGLLEEIYEPWASVILILPNSYMTALMPLLFEHEAEIGETKSFGDNRSEIMLEMPLREMMRNFFDELKSVSSGFASISYEIGEYRKADVVRLDILVAEEPVAAFTRVVSRRRAEEEAEAAVEKLYEILPRQQVQIKLQAKAFGRIISSKTLSGFRKDVTQHMYGGDITRKMKLREKQKKGKKKMQARANVNIPHEVFLKMMKNSKD